MDEHLTKKRRPKKFAEIIGQKFAVMTLTSALNKNVIAPAYLAYGMAGCGKTTIARLFAMALNCENRLDVEPCGTCVECVSIIKGNSMYLREVDGGAFSGIDATRSLLASIGHAVPLNKRAVIIIDECHMLSAASWKALHKTIEEPPPGTIFILCTTEFQKVPRPIQTRCVKLQFPGVSDAELLGAAKQICTVENVQFEEAALKTIVERSAGSVRDMLSDLESLRHTGSVTSAVINQLYQKIDPYSIMAYFNAVVDKNTRDSSKQITGWVRMGISPEIILNSLAEHLRNMIMTWTIEDASVKKMAITQRDNITEARIAAWIPFLFDQLVFIKNYPMSAQLQMDLVTIRLIDTMRDGSARKPRAKKNDGDINSPTAPIPVLGTANASTLDMISISKFIQACQGKTVSCSADSKRYTVLAGNQQYIDIVLEPSAATSPMYILQTDLGVALTNYPQNMQTVIKYK